jgi:DNA-binding PadR family transcriptional regulator
MTSPKMTIQTQAVLRLLLDATDNEMYGLDLIRQSGVQAGTIYPLMKRLEEAGWVTSRWVQPTPGDGGHQRKYYRLTGCGVRSAAAALQKAQARTSRLQGLLGPAPSPRHQAP